MSKKKMKKNKRRAIAPVVLSAAMLATSVFTPAAFAANETSTDTGTNTGAVGEATQSYNVEATGDRGVDLAKTKATVTAGGEASIEADAAIGFKITKIRLNDGTHMETAPVGTGQLLLDGKVYRIDEADGRVAIRLTDVQSDMQIHFFAEMDENYKPANQPFTVSISGEQGVKIDKAVINTSRGQDVDAVAFASPGYQLTKVRLEDGEHTETALIAGKRIVLNGKSYPIENDSGYIKVHLTDISSDIKVYFYADPLKGWGPGYPGWAPYFPDDWYPGWSGPISPSDPDAKTMDIDVSGSLGVELDNSTLHVTRGRNINVVADAKRNYDITKVRVSDGIHTETASVADGCIWVGSHKYIIDVSGGRVTLRLTDVYSNMSVYFFTNADKDSGSNNKDVPYGYYGITLRGDKGIDIDDSLVTVRKGNSTNVSAEAVSGREITKIRVDYGNYQKTAKVDDGQIEINGKVYRVDRDGRRVSIRFTNVRDDIVVQFYSDYDVGNWDYVLNIDGDDGVSIEDESLRVNSGDDLSLVATAKEGYGIKEITLDNGKKSATAKVSSGRIWLDDRMYMIDQSKGRVTLRLKNIDRDMSVYFSTEVDKDNIPIKISDSSQNCSITVSNSYVKKGGTAIYTVTPAYGYALNTITLRIGSQEATASVRVGVIKVGDKSYKMQIAPNGTLTLTVTDVRDTVKLSVDTINIQPNYNNNNGVYPNSNSQNQGQYALYLRSDVRTPYIQGFGNGRFGPKNTLSRAEAATMLARLTNYDAQIAYPTTGIVDIQNNAWYANVANAFYAAGIESSAAFRPNAPITRGELAVWLYRLSGSPVISGSYPSFADTYGQVELTSAVTFGKMQGWIDGYPDG